MGVDYTPNSHKYKAEQQNAVATKKEVKKVINGTAKRKKNEIRKFTDVFTPGDMTNIKEYIVWDLLVPSAKKMLSEAGRVFIDMLLYGEAGSSRGSSRPYDKVSYRDYGSYSSSSRSRESRPRTAFNYDDITIPTRGEAEEVLNCMEDIIDTYKMVSVADLYDLCGISDHNYMNAKYGWTNIRTAEVIRERDGYRLKLPKALPLD